jgi:glycerol-3-phosphate acyltransferase PlsY
MTFVGDILKGAIPVAVVRAMGYPPAIVAWAAIAAFVGAICSVFLKFKGGKGLSASLGIWAVVSPLALLFPLAAWGITLATTRIMSLASMIAALVLIPVAFALSLPQPYVALAVAMSVLAIARHHENIGRLIAGTEPRFTLGKKSDIA